MSSIKAGFIGLGSMGMPMARSLANSTLPLTVFDLRKETCEEIKALGAVVVGSCKEVGAEVPLSKFSDEIDMSIYSAVSERMRR